MSSGLSLAESDSNATRTFKTTFIPADEAAPIQEWDITYNNASEVSCLMDRLKPHFAGYGYTDSDRVALRESVRKQIAETMAKQNPSAPVKPVEDSMIDMILQMSAVDCVPLQNNKESTGYIGLMMYVDDQGKAKGLPVNSRATRTTFECGIPTQVLGDALIARNFDNETNFRRVDFGVAEFNARNAQWKADATKANKERAGSEDKSKQLQELLAKTQQLTTQAAAAPTAPLAKSCSHPACDMDGTMRCSRCKRSWYCSPACQKKDWKFHKANVCIDPKTLATETATTEAAAATETAASS